MSIVMNCTFVGVPATVTFEPVDDGKDYFIKLNHIRLEDKVKVVVVGGSANPSVPKLALDTFVKMLEDYYVAHPESIVERQLGVLIDMQ